MKYIGSAEKLDIQSAKSLADQGIDVFNAKDKFFNDLCYYYIPQSQNGHFFSKFLKIKKGRLRLIFNFDN